VFRAWANGMAEILVIAATRRTKAQFERRSVLGLSLRRLTFDARIGSEIAWENKRGLPGVFNEQIVEKNRGKILAFTHDDVRIDDYWLSTRLDEALRIFDVIGVAGNRRRMRNQPAWAFTPEMQWDKGRNLSGGVAHFQRSGESVSLFGKPRQKCRLLDGVFLAVKAASLLDRKVRFDNRFAFHFYDLDFCRSAEQRGLTLGTWPIAITHTSKGSFGSSEWKRALTIYLRKWHD
jgi:GT2 family glycosyltransferase